MMAASISSSKSLKEYLKRYESNVEDDKKKKKKKKRATTLKSNALGVSVVDEDPVWQKPINIEVENADSSTDEEKPQVDEDIEVKRMRRLEELKAKRPYNSINDDGSGWVSLSSNQASSSVANTDMSPPRRARARNDTPSPSNELKASISASGEEGNDYPPIRRRQGHYRTSLELEEKSATYTNSDSPPRKQKFWKDTASQGTNAGHDDTQEDFDLSPPRQRRKSHHTLSPEPDANPAHSITPNYDISPPRRSDRRASKASLRDSHKATKFSDLSPPLRKISVSIDDARGFDLSPPRKQRTGVMRNESSELSAQHSQVHSVGDTSHGSLPTDLSPPRKKQKEPSVPESKQKHLTGLLTQEEFREDISKTNKDDWMRFRESNPSVSSNSEVVYRDKITGDRISKEEFMKSRGKIKEQPKEIKLEWGKGLAQKREAEAKLLELELEKDKPFARTRDDAQLDNMLKDRVRWGDPMAHLVKKKHSELVLSDLGDSEKMRESGFVIPQDVPAHSWLKRGLDAAPNRYGIRPGRHWDGVDRSNGFEKQMFKRMNEKQATEKEAYLWSVSDM